MTTENKQHDLSLKNGPLLETAQNIYYNRDIAFKDGLVSGVETEISSELSASTIDVSGKLVTPGLIDLHGHFYHGGTGSAVHADQNCLSAGVTTGVDAGSSGFLNYGAMRD